MNHKEMIDYTKQISLDQYNRYKGMSVNELALYHMGEISQDSVRLAIRWFNRCRAVENRIGGENRARNLRALKPEPKWISKSIEKAEVRHYEG